MRRATKIVLGLSFVLFALLILISIIKFSSLIGLFFIYPWVKELLSPVGLNPYVVKAIAIGSTIILWAIIFRLIFKWGSGKEIFLGISKRTWGIILLVGFFIAQAVGMFYVTKDVSFLSDGQAAKYYTRNPITGELQVFDSEIYDAFGQKAQPMTFEVAKELAAEKMYPQAEIPAYQIKNFFDRQTGKPLVYYYQDKNNVCHFFVQEGYSPLTGDKLLPVTEEVKKKCEGKITIDEEKIKIKQESENLEKQKAYLKEQARKVAEAQEDYKKRQAALDEEQERILQEKARLARERIRLNKIKEQVDISAVAEDKTRPATGRVHIKGDKELEIHLDLSQPVSAR